MTGDEAVTVPFDEAIKRLPDGDYIHTFRQAGPVMIGADWDRDEMFKAMRGATRIEETGTTAQAMGHGLAIFDAGGWLFIETKRHENKT